MAYNFKHIIKKTSRERKDTKNTKNISVEKHGTIGNKIVKPDY